MTHYSFGFIQGGGLTPFFAWNPEEAEELPGTSTFTRASIKQVLTKTTTLNWYQEIKSGEVSLGGLRRVENLLDSSTGTGPFTAVTKDGRIAVSVIADTGTLTITIGGTPQVFTPTGTPQRFVAFDDATGGSTTVAISGTATLSQPMAHLCRVGEDVPEPYVQHDAEFLNIGVNGVRYFNTQNTSTVDGSGVVTEAAGTTITGGGYLPQPAATNQFITNDLTDAEWNLSGMDAPTFNGVNDLGLNEYELTVTVGSSSHRISDNAQSGSAGSAYIIAEAGTGRYIIIRRGSSTSADYACFDLQAGSITEEGAGIDDALITDLGNGRYKCEINTSDTSSTFEIAASDSGTPGSGRPVYVGAGETYLVCHEQYENTAFSTSPIITSGSTVTRVADSLTDTTWPSEASAVIDTTVNVVIPGGTIDLQQNMLGFGDNSAHSFVLSAASVARIFTGGINSFIVAGDSYEDERHDFGMSFQVNEGIVVDDESNDNTDATGTPNGGTIYIGLNSGLVGVPGLYHRIRIYDVVQTVAQLEDLF